LCRILTKAPAASAAAVESVDVAATLEPGDKVSTP
jgi:hypothetical protein